jgi:hypothetical protein
LALFSERVSHEVESAFPLQVLAPWSNPQHNGPPL